MKRQIAKAIAIILFSIVLLPQTLYAKALITHKEIKENKDQIILNIPQVTNLDNKNVQNNINMLLSEPLLKELKRFKEMTDKNDYLTAEMRKNFQFLSDYEVKLNNKNILSIVQHSYQFTGGAHGMPVDATLTVNVKTGKVYELADLFYANSNFIAKINDIIKQEIVLRKKESVYNFTGVPLNQTFFLTREGLTIVFQPYEIGPYSEGFVYFFIQYNQLPDINHSEILY